MAEPDELEEWMRAEPDGVRVPRALVGRDDLVDLVKRFAQAKHEGRTTKGAQPLIDRFLRPAGVHIGPTALRNYVAHLIRELENGRDI